MPLQICVISQLDNYAAMANTHVHARTHVQYSDLVQINNKAAEKPELGEAFCKQILREFLAQC